MRYGSERSLQGVEVVGGVPNRAQRSSLVVLPDIEQAMADEALESATSANRDPKRAKVRPLTVRRGTEPRFRRLLPTAPPAYRPRGLCEPPISSL